MPGDASSLFSTPGVLCAVLGSPLQERRESREGPQRRLRDCSISPVRKG